jgi:hypothetical protein
MSTLLVSEVRARVAAQLATIDGWALSRWTYEAFPFVEPSFYKHHVFAVGCPRTEFGEVESSPTRRGPAGGRVTTTIGVRWLHQIRKDNQTEDYDAALDAENDLVKALVALDRTALGVGIVEMRRVVVEEGAWLLGEITASATHRYAIQ